MIIIGSTAMQYHGCATRKPKDIDVMIDEESENISGFDCIRVPKHILEMIPHSNRFATPDAIYTIKCSHLGWDIKWQKHKNDVIVMKRLQNLKLIPELYETLVKYWKEINGNKPFLSMNKNKGEFFNDHVTYVYDHDYLHELVAYPNAPVYTHCLKDNADVAIDKDKFFALPFEQQLRMFKEEISVIAAERWLIPPKVIGKYHWRQAYSFALQKTVTALTKNWATDFLIKNLEYFVKPEYAYFEHLFNTLKEGEIIMSKKVPSGKAKEIRNNILAEYAKKDSHRFWYIDEYNEDGTIDFDSNSCLWDELTELSTFGDFKRIEQEGGGEGEGEYCHFVFSWKGQLYKLVYSYYSHEGCNFDGCDLYEVEAKEKVITVYE